MARFHELVTGKIKKNPPLRVLCRIDEAEFEETIQGQRARTAEEIELFLNALYQQKLIRLKNGTDDESLGVGVEIRDLMDIWLAETKSTRSGRTLDDYMTSKRYYLEALGNHKADRFPSSFGTHLINYLQKKGIDSRTVYKHVVNLQTFLNWAFKSKHLSERKELPRPLKVTKEPRIYTNVQLRKIEQILEQKIASGRKDSSTIQRINQLRAFRLAVYTAMRGGEIWSLRLENIRLADRVILIRNAPEIDFFVKGRKEARVPIGGGLAEFLGRDLAEREPSERWFLDDGSGNQLYKTEATLARPFAKINEELGIRGVKPLHGIRATVITHLLEKGAEITRVQKLARHRLITTTKGYQNTEGLDCLPIVDSIELLVDN